MRRFQSPKVDPVIQELQQLEQKIEVTAAARANAEQAAAVTGDYEEFRPVIEDKTRSLHYLEAQRDVLLRRRYQPEAER